MNRYGYRIRRLDSDEVVLAIYTNEPEKEELNKIPCIRVYFNGDMTKATRIVILESETDITEISDSLYMSRQGFENVSISDLINLSLECNEVVYAGNTH